MSKIEIMTLQHVDDVTEVENACFYTAWTKQDFIKEITENKLAIYLVAIEDEKVIGYCGMWHIVDEGHITNIAVLEQYRNRGIATNLINELINIGQSRGILSFTLEVRMGNTKAQKLYQKFGFRPEGIRKGYYSDTKEDAIIMWKHFNDIATKER